MAQPAGIPLRAGLRLRARLRRDAKAERSKRRCALELTTIDAAHALPPDQLWSALCAPGFIVELAVGHRIPRCTAGTTPVLPVGPSRHDLTSGVTCRRSSKARSSALSAHGHEDR